MAERNENFSGSPCPARDASLLGAQIHASGRRFEERLNTAFACCRRAGLAGRAVPVQGGGPLVLEGLARGRKTVAKQPDSGIIGGDERKAGKQDVQFVGKIDRKLYSCVSEEITTDEVIITDERVQHIIDRRGKEFYETYSPAFAEILADPDYIFADNRPNTALACKTLNRDGTTVNIVLRFAVESDDPQFKNSIITAIKENKKRFTQRIRNHDPLYKKE